MDFTSRRGMRNKDSPLSENNGGRKRADTGVILEDEEINKHFSLMISFMDLFENNPKLGSSILLKPEETLLDCDLKVVEAQAALIAERVNRQNVVTKRNVHVRIFGLPACPDIDRSIFPTNDDIGLFLQVSGTVLRTTAAKLLEFQREYVCNKCHLKVTVDADYDQMYTFETPKRCGNSSCKGKLIQNVMDAAHCRNYQEVKIQEKVSSLEAGAIPIMMWITLEDDLVDICQSGDSVTVCGVIKTRWKKPINGNKLELVLSIKTNHVRVNNDCGAAVVTNDVLKFFDEFWDKYRDCPLSGRDIILQSFCPKIFGMYLVKLAIVTVLAGGSTSQKKNGKRERTEPHILLEGAPGTGKSQLLRFASKVIPRSVLTTGIGTTSAGLTVAAIKEAGRWQLECGALVLADGGICCIDEFNSLKDSVKISCYEVMEQQTISVAKASIVTRLNTRCSILAATNSINVALQSPLLSRFDLHILINDRVDNDWDELVSAYILGGYKSKFIDTKTSAWNLEFLQAYFAVIKKLNPLQTEHSKLILNSYYQAQRQTHNRSKARCTVRLLDSLVRLSEAHARLMYHHKVDITDAIMAVILIETSMQSESRITCINFDVHADFPVDPFDNYKELASFILKRLSLEYMLDDEPHEIDTKIESKEMNKEGKKPDEGNQNEYEEMKHQNDCIEKENVGCETKIFQDMKLVGTSTDNRTPFETLNQELFEEVEHSAKKVKYNVEINSKAVSDLETDNKNNCSFREENVLVSQSSTIYKDSDLNDTDFEL